MSIPWAVACATSKPGQRAIMALLFARSDRSRAMNWIQIGATAGSTIELVPLVLDRGLLRRAGLPE